MNATLKLLIAAALAVFQPFLFAHALDADRIQPHLKVDLKIPDNLKGAGSREGYFYTPGPVVVVGYEIPAVVTIRDPANPEPPVATGAMDSNNPTFVTTLAAGFYYISVTGDAGVLAGVSDTNTCNGYYHYVSSGEAYGNSALSSRYYFRGTGGCDNRMLIFSPQGASAGGTCCDILCIDFCGISFDLSNADQYYDWGPGNVFGFLGVNSGNPVQMLARDDQGYFVPPYTAPGSDTTGFWTYHGQDEYLNIHSFDDNVGYNIISLHSDSFGTIESGTLENGETYSYLGTANNNNRVVRVETTAGKASVSVLGGTTPSDNTNYMTYVLDQNGQFQGTDFITRASSGGFLFLTGLQDDTVVEIRSASTETLQSVHQLDEAQVVDASPGEGIWRIRSTHEITALVGQGNGGTFVPLTQNVSGSTPYPPVIAGVRWNPYHPKITDPSIQVTFLTDELSYSALNYRIGNGPWQRTAETPPALQHSHTIPLPALTFDTPVRFRPEARDQSGNITIDDRGGSDYVVIVNKEQPYINVSVHTVIPQSGYTTIRFRVENIGDGTARRVRLLPEIQGSQPFGNGIRGDYRFIEDGRMDVSLDVPDVPPGGTTFVDLNLVPFIRNTSVGGGLFSCGSEVYDIYGGRTQRTHPDCFHFFNKEEILSYVENTNYVVLANPSNFVGIDDTSNLSTQRMVQKMAEFTIRRGGVLAYTDSTDSNEIRDLIKNRFDGKISSSWHQGGYLLLVGSSVEFPSFERTVSCVFGGEQTVTFADNVYADVDRDDNKTPELILGRITGNHHDTYTSLFDRALSPNHFDKTLTVSGTGDGDSDFYTSARECNELLMQRYGESFIYRLRNFEESIRNNVYLFNSLNTDFIYYRNHGSVGGWDDFAYFHVPNISFGGKFPIIYSNACLTGQLQSDNNLAEAFLDQHASVFIGATEVSPRDGNNALGKKIVNYHKQGQSIGQAFRNGKRSLAGDLSWYSLCWSRLTVSRENLLYNLYGDPFRGTTSDFPKASLDKGTFDPPVGTLDITIPFYEVQTEDGLDYVDIPDDEAGGHLSVVNEPLVPSYRVTANYAPGIRVADIEMTSRSGQSNAAGLVLPVAWWNQKVHMTPADMPSPGTFPSDAFHWQTLERVDGGQELMLTVHPFFYNATTQDATFYQDYSFHIEFVTSTVIIDAVTSTYDAVPLGQNQGIDVHVTNTGASETRVNVSLEIEDQGSYDTVSSQSQNNLLLPAGGSLVRHFTWDPAGSANTHYQAIARVSEFATQNELDLGYDEFRVGVPDLGFDQLTLETEEPGYIAPGEQAALGMVVHSTGDIPVSGTLTLEIRNEDEGYLVEQWQHKFFDLVPGATLTYSATWDSTGIPRGRYRLNGWVEHQGGLAPLQFISFETLNRMSWNWGDLRDVYRRGEKIVGTANLQHPNGAIVGLADGAGLSVERPDMDSFDPGLDTHGMDPFYGTQFQITALEPSGLHALIASATKSGYEDVVHRRWFVATENPFTLHATPEVAVADGMTLVRVESDIITEGTATVMDGTLVTVDPLVGEVADADASPGMAGTQIAAVSGQIAFDWRAPDTTALEAFAHAHVSEEGPQSGISVVFKGVDFNDNRRVDVADIAIVHASEGERFGTGAFDTRFDLNGDDLIDATDTGEVLDRWGLEFSDASSCPECLPEQRSYGVRIRPEPERALIPPGGELTVSILAENLDRMGGYEFGAVLLGDAVAWMGPPEHNPALKTVGSTQHPLGPDPYGEEGYRLGAAFIQEPTGVSGTTLLATVKLTAAQIGEATLVLSAPVIARVNGTQQAVMRAVQGVYQVGFPDPTPTATATVTQTPSVTPTQTAVATPSPTVTPRSLEDFDIWPVPDGDGRIDARDLLEWLGRISSEQEQEELILDFARFWEQPPQL
jgi:hypothetical protein